MVIALKVPHMNFKPQLRLRYSTPSIRRDKTIPLRSVHILKTGMTEAGGAQAAREETTLSREHYTANTRRKEGYQGEELQDYRPLNESGLCIPHQSTMEEIYKERASQRDTQGALNSIMRAP